MTNCIAVMSARTEFSLSEVIDEIAERIIYEHRFYGFSPVTVDDVITEFEIPIGEKCAAGIVLRRNDVRVAMQLAGF